MEHEDIEEMLSVLRSPTSSATEVKDVIQSIADTIQGDLSTVEAQIYVAMVFDAQQGILKFIMDVYLQGMLEEHNDNVKQSFEILEYLVTNFKMSVEPHSDNIIHWCARSLLHEGQIRDLSLKLMKLIIHFCPCTKVDMKNVVSRLKLFLDDSKKLSKTIIHYVLELLGEICINQPLSIHDTRDWFASCLIRLLNENETAKQNSNTLVEGCFNGLFGYMANFNLSSEQISCIYKHITKFYRYESDVRHTAGRAALRLYVKYASQFSKFICKDVRSLLNTFSAWTRSHQSSEHKKLGLSALTETYRQLSCSIENLNEDAAKTLFDSVRTELEDDLFKKSTSAVGYDRKATIIGLAELSRAYKKLGLQDELMAILTAFNSLSDSGHDSEGYSTSIYVESIAKILAVLDTAPTSHLCRLSVLLIEQFPQTPSNFKMGSAIALESSFIALLPRSSTELETHIRVILYQGLIRSCAYPLHVDVQLIENDESFGCSYKSFLDLWTHLLTMKSRSSSATVGSIVYDSFVTVFIDLIKKLDLNLVTANTELSDPSLAYDARTPSDFQIFVNLVDLFQDLIPCSDKGLLVKWLPYIFNETMLLSKRFPLVSGFYKIIGVSFKAAGSEYIVEDSDLVKMMDFTENVMMKILMQKDDLQISCLTMVLQSPLSLIEPLLDRLGPALLAAVRVGTGYPELLQLLISSLDIWLLKLPTSKIQKLLREILPHMRFLLYSTGNNQRTQGLIKNGKRTLKVGGKIKVRYNIPADKQSLTLQKQFILFLGKLDPAVYPTFTEPVEDYALSPGSPLYYKIPFQSFHAFLELNRLVPRVLDLVSSSGDRKIRITACELLHAVILLTVERSRQPNPNTELFRKLVSTALVLSCDSDRVVHDLFKPLLLQICRYYSGPVQSLSNETAVVIELLTEGCAHPSDSSIRDFSGLCIREFIAWSRRQRNEHSDRSPVNARAIIRIICDSSSHPDPSKRLGAAVMFNNIYTELREDKQLMSIYWFQLYHCLLHGLEICDDDESARVILSSLDHIRRPLIEMSHIFLVPCDNRRIPKEFQGATLIELAIYTFHKGTSRSSHVRTVVRDIFMAVLKIIPGKPSMKEFLSIRQLPIECKALNSSPGSIVAVLDYINWLLEERAITIKDIGGSHVFDLSSSLLDKILQHPNPEQETVHCLLRFFSNTSGNVGIDCAGNLARLLFTIKIPVREEFVRLLARLSSNKSAMESFISCLPRLDRNFLESQLKRLDQISFFLGFEILDASLLLSEKYVGSDILDLLFNCLFSSNIGRRVNVKFIDPHFQQHLKKMLKFALKFNVSIDAMFKFLMDKTVVHYSERTSKKGDVFFNTYQDNIIEYIVKVDATADYILKLGDVGVPWIIKILKYCVEKRDKQESDAIIRHYLKNWNQLESIVKDHDVRITILELLASNKQYGCFIDCEGPFQFIHQLLRSKTKSIQEITSSFALLPHICSLEETSNPELTTSLTTFRRQNPLYFVEGINKSLSEIVIRKMYKGLFSSFKTTSSLVVLKFIVENMGTHQRIISSEDLDVELTSNVQIVPHDHMLRMVNQLFIMVKSPMDLKSATCIRERLAAILQVCSEKLVMDFFGSHLGEMYKIINELNNVDERLHLRNRTTCVCLLEVLYMKTTMNSRIVLQNMHTHISDLFKTILNKCASDLSSKQQSKGGYLSRVYYCACVKLLCVCVCQSKIERFYNLFLFRLPIWKLVTDFEAKYNLSMDFSQIPKRKKLLTSIRRTHEDNQKECLVYPQSQALFESSLREDVTKFDMTTLALSQTPRIASDAPGKFRIIELELDTLNEHEVVASICGVIQHMVAEKIKPDNNMPCWLISFQDVLAEEGQCNNSKLLVLKMMHNLQYLVKPYALHCAHGILSAVVTIITETGTNYLITDLVSMLLDWHPDFNNSKPELTLLIKCLISRPNTARKDILKYIIELVKGVVEKWKSFMDDADVTAFLVARLSDSDNLECYISLHLTSIILTNKLFHSKKEWVETLFKWLLECIRAKNSNIEFASEVLGQALNCLRDLDNFSSLSGEICSAIIELNRKEAKDGNSIIDSRLYNIHKFYPEISSHELLVANLEMRSLQDKSIIQQHCLEMLLSHVKRGHHLQEPSTLISEALKANIPVVTNLSIQIFEEYIQKFSTDELQNLLLQIIKLTSIPVAEVRLVSCRALIIAQNLMFEASDDVTKAIKNALLKRLNDTDERVRTICEAYWYDSKLSMSDIREKLLHIFKEIYSPEAESDFAAYACSFIFTVISNTSSYELPIFDYPLGECSYSDYQILSSWRVRHSTLAPMFAPSVAGELSRLDYDRPVSPSAYQERIIATARSLLFSPTLLDEPITDAPQSLQSLEVTDTEGEVFKKPKAPVRFFRTTKSNASAMFARRAVVARDRDVIEGKERIKRRDTDVKLYRNYRKGDYPDIQIKHSNFIAPLVALARKDSHLAKLLLVHVFHSITRDISRGDQFWSKIEQALNSLLKESLCDTLFLSFLFQLAFENDLLLNVDNVCLAAKYSNLMTLGSLIVEQAIVKFENCGERKEKKNKGEEDEGDLLWLKLAQLFQDMQEADIHQGIYLDKLKVIGPPEVAIKSEATLSWKAAVENYGAAIKEKNSDERLEFYLASYLKCLENLGSWKEVLEQTLLIVSGEKHRLWEEAYEFLLPSYVRSRLITDLRNKTNELHAELANIPAFRIRSNFQLERTIGSWLEKDYPKTLTYFNRTCLSFLSDWSQMNNWDTKRKERNLLQLQLFNEMNDVIEVVSAASRESAIDQTLKNWSKNSPTAQSSLVMWDIRLTMRKRFAIYLEDNGISDSKLQEMNNSLRSTELSLTHAALELENIGIANKYYKLSKRENDVESLYCYNTLRALNIKLNDDTPQDKFKKYLEICNAFEQRISNTMELEDPCEETRRVKARIALLNILSAAGTLAEDHNINTRMTLKENWKNHAESIIGTLGSGETELILKGKVYVDIAKFYRKHGEATNAAKAILKGMSCSNSEAQHLFGWVLTLDEVEDSSELSELSASIPTWMFLFWRNQLLAFLASGKTSLIKDVIKRIATEYPKSISHSFRISLEGYSKTMVQDGFVKEMCRLLLSDSHEETLVKAISRVASPLLKLKYYLAQVLEKVGELEVAKECLKVVFDFITDPENGSKYECLQQFKFEIQELMSAINSETLKERLKAIIKKVDAAKNINKSEKQLKLYSPWLSSFQISSATYNLEIPGQYDGLHEPRVESHIRIVSFKQEIRCMPSIRQPFKVTMLGNNAKEYSFLVKFGEDLRQDDRIQQVLKHMQNTLQSNVLTKDLHLEGFSVIPLTTSCGIIEWVDSTKSFKDLLSEKISAEKISEAQREHLSFLSEGAGRVFNPSGRYLWAYNNLSHDNAIRGFNRILHKLPESALRDVFWRLSSSPEHMFYLRRNFAKSVAAMSIGHWLIGVGDRHLDNTLISTRTGRVIGIDFGVAFGHATQSLVPVELIPFRLTPQILNVFSPLNESGWLKQTMIRSLSVLCEDITTLLALLEVFVLEPSLDWKEQAERLARERGVDEHADISDHYPRQKIDSVERKLTGVNPIAEIEKDLRSNRHIPGDLLPRIVAILRGKHDSIRAELSQTTLTPEEQVVALIDVAKDPLVLSFTYVGWSPWL